MSFQFAIPRQSRRPSLTPMIDVVFLLLVFFMLVARFGQDGALPLSLTGQQDSTYSGPPRLVDVLPDGQRLNGQDAELSQIVAHLHELIPDPADMIILRGRDGASLQRLVTVLSELEQAGFTRLVLIE
ncbi:biopolymer transporter ExbD [Rhodophyticola sp. CCM32]|uniref:ExbD/TolR family protein n=1 Tax=Rhodophyticola sp. CCM32 TaxID=2916397 RepID=UPI00107F74FE|nr:biopolymer transporter ExbD [Rhodophyticola sp. CCM32]QBY01862.1 biopolymer transporter ExbD [Rhodophyticola sp. CCM32]